MATALPVELYEILEDRLGREQAHDIVKALENAADRISLQKKLELRDELSKELARILPDVVLHVIQARG